MEYWSVGKILKYPEFLISINQHSSTPVLHNKYFKVKPIGFDHLFRVMASMPKLHSLFIKFLQYGALTPQNMLSDQLFHTIRIPLSDGL